MRRLAVFGDVPKRDRVPPRRHAVGGGTLGRLYRSTRPLLAMSWPNGVP